MKLFKIRNRVLRFLAGLVMLVVILAMIAGGITGIGYLAKPLLYNYAYPFYQFIAIQSGYNLLDTLFFGLLVVAFPTFAVYFLCLIGWAIYTAAKSLGENFFDSK